MNTNPQVLTNHNTKIHFDFIKYKNGTQKSNQNNTKEFQI